MFKSVFLYKVCFVFLLVILVMNISCRKDLDFENSGPITFRFSQDTVFLDTVFTNSNSETFLVKIFNDTDKDVLISNLYLNQKNKSPFRINVDGRTAYEFNDIALRGKDSLMVFVEIALGDASQDWIAEDEIIFDNQQQIKLLATVENAIYHYPKDGAQFSEINTNTTWDASHAHIIYGDLRVAENKTLKLDAGTKVYLHQDSRLELDKNAHLIAQGKQDSKIVFRSDRQTPRYDSLPKQWEEIKLMPESKIDAQYVVIKGANKGLHLDHATAALKNVEIYNAGSSGIFSNNSSIVGSNVVISDAADASLNIENGGHYTFYFSTFANEGKTSVVGNSGPNIPLYLSDYTTKDNKEINNPLNGTFINSIFYGRYPNGVVLDFKNENHVSINFESCLIRNEDQKTIDYTTHPKFKHTVLENPLFISTLYSNQNLRLNQDSPAKSQGNPLYIKEAPQDLDGIIRKNPPSIGAYD